MTQEEKDLLLKDLCARLPYGVKVQDEIGRINKLVIGNADLVRLYHNDFSIYSEEKLSVPYLVPLSSMTEEQQKNLTKFVANGINGENILYDWYNKNHFDYRNLINKNLIYYVLTLI